MHGTRYHHRSFRNDLGDAQHHRQVSARVVGALSARSAVVHQSASTVVSAQSARSAVGQESASTVVGAMIARSVAKVIHQTLFSTRPAPTRTRSHHASSLLRQLRLVVSPVATLRPRLPRLPRRRDFLLRRVRHQPRKRQVPGVMLRLLPGMRRDDTHRLERF